MLKHFAAHEDMENKNVNGKIVFQGSDEQACQSKKRFGFSTMLNSVWL